ncbi:MAG TPA: hypothetical protein VKZ97_09295 [Flavobacteriaceae bacterium]|nr:hypothetical protein [Flavobacteriaceae bacterium]
MIKNIGSYIALSLTISVLLYVSLKGTDKQVSLDSNTTVIESVEENDLSHGPEHDELLAIAATAKAFSPQLGKSFVGFKEALAFKESQGNYFSVNSYGYLGKYQFGKETLKLIGVYNPIQFLNNPELQEKAFLANAERNKWVLRREIRNFVGTKINGITITESGILAAAHLAGPGSVKNYLRSYGEDNFADAYGTTIEYYMKKFSGYDTSFVKANKKAKVKTTV